jgi:hypothetical protein
MVRRQNLSPQTNIHSKEPCIKIQEDMSFLITWKWAIMRVEKERIGVTTKNGKNSAA